MDASFSAKTGRAPEAFLAKSRNTFSGAGTPTTDIVPDIVSGLMSLEMQVGDTRALNLEGKRLECKKLWDAKSLSSA